MQSSSFLNRQLISLVLGIVIGLGIAALDLRSPLRLALFSPSLVHFWIARPNTHSAHPSVIDIAYTWSEFMHQKRKLA